MPSGAGLRALLSMPRALNHAIAGFERWISSAATLILIFEGESQAAHEAASQAQRLLRKLDGQSLGEGPARAWLAHRYSVSFRQSKVFQQGCFNDTLEVAAPWSRLSHVYEAVREAAGSHALVLAHLSHAYPDGCSIYFTFVASRSGDALGRYDSLIDAALGAALAEGASLSHHHGVGTSKAHFLDAELGGGYFVLETLRRAWDPERLLNPQTFVPRRSMAEVAGRGTVPGIDACSGIATFRGETPLLELEQQARQSGFSLGLTTPVPALSLAEFVAQGLPGLPDSFEDPVRGSLCGLVARGARASFALLPAPRRATGPDLSALCVGAGGAIANVVEASLALVRVTAPRATSTPSSTPLLTAEQQAWTRVVRAFADSR
jgi:alkyldihydroxyacetonephosphate synthase